VNVHVYVYGAVYGAGAGAGVGVGVGARAGVGGAGRIEPSSADRPPPTGFAHGPSELSERPAITLDALAGHDVIAR
jgi:hypothetical protein